MSMADLDNKIVKQIISLAKLSIKEKSVFGLVAPAEVPEHLFRCCFLETCDSIDNFIPGHGKISKLICKFKTPLFELRSQDRRALVTWGLGHEKDFYYSTTFLKKKGVRLFACYTHFVHVESQIALDPATWYELNSLDEYYLSLPSCLRGRGEIIRMEKGWEDALAGPENPVVDHGSPSVVIEVTPEAPGTSMQGRCESAPVESLNAPK